MTHAKAEAQMARKYGVEAWAWMPHWGKVRNRLSQAIHERRNRRMTYLAMIAPAIVASAATSFLIAVLR